MHKKKLSLRIKITAIVIGIVLTSMLAVFLASYLIIRSETDRYSVDMLNLIGKDTGKSLENYFESIEQSVEMAANIAIEDLDSVLLAECGVIRTDSEEYEQTPEQAASLDAYLEEYCGQIQEILSGIAAYTQGVTAYYYCISPLISINNAGFYYRKMGKTGFIKQPALEVEGLETIESLNATWYEAAVSHGRPVWVGPYIPGADFEDKWICSYFAPIYKSGMLIGLIGMDILCDALIEQIHSIKVYHSGYVCLLDKNNKVIYHPALPIGSNMDELGLSISAQVFQSESSNEMLFRYEANGVDRQMSFFTLRNGMKLVSIAPANEINAPWIRLIRIIAMITVLVILSCIVVSLFTIRSLTYPLKQLTDASLRLANSDYDVDLTYQEKDEIGTLTRSFMRMRDQIRQYISDLNHQLYHDRLTDLPNMRHFFSLAKEAKDQLLAKGKSPVLLYFDIIGLSHYNRQHGFEKGDNLIQAFSVILARSFGDHQICRFGGDHFAAVSDEDLVEEELKRVLKECETAADGGRLPVRVGVYPYRLEEVDVNIACDRAKFAGELKKGDLNSSITFYDEEMLKKAELSHHIVHSLDQALAQGWVKVYYQPIIRAVEGKICDEEALARWIDPVYGFLSPAFFIPALEESKLIYKLDLYVLEQILEKMKQQAEAGIYLVPQSVNLSRMDFESCDMVEEIRRRVDIAGISRSLITIEITESVIGGDFDFMKEQVFRFKELGFPVWMDDFGSGYSSLDVLQLIHFDLIKFDMRFMERFGEGDENEIILNELMNMAIGLGMDTVCEGVETYEQLEFLREIGCTRIQGYYYGKPVPFEGIHPRHKDKNSLEYENPEESEYFASLGRINLYHITALAKENDESLKQYFDTLPMCILEVNGTKLKYNRCNRSYRDFLARIIGREYSMAEFDYQKEPDRVGGFFFRTALQCARDGLRTIIDVKVNSNTIVHTLIWRVALNPVTGTAAVTAVVLAIVNKEENDGTDYNQMAKVLATDYVNLYYVNLYDETFIEYTPDSEREDLVMERHGGDFFAVSWRDALLHLYKEDQEYFIHSFTKENMVNKLDSEGKFKMTYRLMMNGTPTYVDLKAVRIPGDPSHIMIGVSNIDAQMHQREEVSRLQAEKTAYSRIGALSQGLLCMYVIDPGTGSYTEYRAISDYAGLGLPTEGENFFAAAVKEIDSRIYPEDIIKVKTLLTRENILSQIEKNKTYAFSYRLMLDGTFRHVRLEAALQDEQNKTMLIIGVTDIDKLIRQEQEFERKLSKARSKVDLDVLTGVKNKKTYETMSELLTQQIEAGQNINYAIVLCCLKDLAKINETLGRRAGDQQLREVCDVICEIFKHSPVFRVAGDQFAVIAQGHDYEYIDSLTAALKESLSRRELSVSSGMARYDGSESASSVFTRAEQSARE